MNILLTGATGFVGKNIRNKSSNHNIIAISTTESLDCINVAKNFEDIEIVLKNIEIDCILHIAAVVPSNFNNASFNEVFLPNAIMMDHLYQLALKKKVKKFIYLSGFGSMQDYNHYKMKDYYTLSKVHGEHVCAMLEANNISTASLRIPAPYGEGSNKNSVINMFIQNALQNMPIKVYGTGIREQNFIYIDDVVHAVELFINTDKNLDGIYSIVSEKNTSMIELAQIIKELCNSNSEIIIGEKPDEQELFKPSYDYLRAKNEVGYEPNYDIHSGLSDYIKIYRENI